MAYKQSFEREALESFIMAAKAATYAGDGQKLLAYRQGSHDLQHHDGAWTYHDCYFGGADFMGEEVVYFRGEPVWGMNYYGRLLREDLLSAAETGQTIKRSLTALYGEGRFLGGADKTALRRLNSHSLCFVFQSAKADFVCVAAVSTARVAARTPSATGLRANQRGKARSSAGAASTVIVWLRRASA